MKSDDTKFVDFIDEQLDGLEIKAVRMFDSYGLYKGDAFLGIIANSQLFFKTSGKTKEKYIARGMMPFSPSKLQVMPDYLQVPTDVLENREILKAWALEAAACEGQ